MNNDEKYYAVGMPVRYAWGEPGPDNIRTGMIVENSDFRRGFYVIKDDRNGEKYNISANRILGYAANRIDDSSIRKAFGLDVKNDIYENIKKQINKDQLNFHYGLNSIFKLATNDAAVPFELSEKEKEYVHDDMVATMSYLCDLHKNGFYGTGTDTKILINDIKEDNKMKKEQKKRNRNIIKTEKYQRTIKDITFNGPAVIVKFEPSDEDLAWGRFKGDKVVVVCKDCDKYDMKTGFLLAILKEFLNNQSYGNILEKLDSFDALDIPQVGKEIDKKMVLEEAEKKRYILAEDDKCNGFKFNLGDIVRLKSGLATFEVIGTLTWRYSGREIKRYRLRRLSGTHYTTYENENRLIKVLNKE